MHCSVRETKDHGIRKGRLCHCQPTSLAHDDIPVMLVSQHQPEDRDTMVAAGQAAETGPVAPLPQLAPNWQIRPEDVRPRGTMGQRLTGNGCAAVSHRGACCRSCPDTLVRTSQTWRCARLRGPAARNEPSAGSRLAGVSKPTTLAARMPCLRGATYCSCTPSQRSDETSTDMRAALTEHLHQPVCARAGIHCSADSLWHVPQNSSLGPLAIKVIGTC